MADLPGISTNVTPGARKVKKIRTRVKERQTHFLHSNPQTSEREKKPRRERGKVRRGKLPAGKGAKDFLCDRKLRYLFVSLELRINIQSSEIGLFVPLFFFLFGTELERAKLCRGSEF